MSIKFLEVQFQNFLSYGNNITTINLNRPDVTLIIGENLDDPSSGSNGVGKTSLASALVYCLYDKALSDIKVNDLINNINKKNMFVSVIFKKDNDYYKIFRARKYGRSSDNIIQIFKNTEYEFTNEHDITPMAANQEIQQIIGMDYHMFVRMVVISATQSSFLRLPVASGTVNQVDFIEQLFDLTILSEKSVVLKSKIKENETDVKFETQKIESLEKEYKQIQDQINSTKARVDTWETSRQSKLRDLSEQLTLINDIDIEREQKYYKISNQLSKSINDIVSNAKHKNNQLKVLANSLAQKHNEHKHLSDNKCPYCLQQFTNIDKIDELTNQIDEYTTEISTLQDEIDELVKQQDKLISEKTEIDNAMTFKDNLDELINIHSQKHTIENKIIELQNAVNAYHEPLNELLNIPKPILYYEKNDKLKKEIEHQEFLYKLLTKKDSFIRKAILNQNLPYLNARLQFYLNSLGLPYKVHFEQDMTPTINHFGRALSFNNLSNGQQARVNIALSMAFRDILQKLHTSINILLLDESLDYGLDNSGVASAIRMLKHKALDENLSLYIISHRDEISNLFNSTLTIQMKNGFSQVV